MIELRHLRYFRAVAEELHFGKAAQRLNIAQPALSRQIRRLEEEIGTLLFARTQRSVALTAAGEVFLSRTREILNAVSMAAMEAKDTADGRLGHLRVAFIHSSTYNLIPNALDAFTTRHSGIRLDLQEMTVIDQLKALVGQDVDIGLLRPPVDNPLLEFESVTRETFVLAVPRPHPLAAENLVELQHLKNESFIMFDRRKSPLFHSRIMNACEAAGFQPRVTQEAIQIHTVLGLVGAGLGIALMPIAAVRQSTPRVRFLAVTPPIPSVEIGLAWRRDDQNPALAFFREAVKEGVDALSELDRKNICAVNSWGLDLP